MKKNEHNLQVSCVNWFRYQYPKHLIYAIPNGGSRNAIEACNLKREGVTAGIPDLHIPAAKNGFNGLYVEMKYGKNKTTETQNIIIEKLRNEGYQCEVVYTLDEFMGVITEYLK